MRNRLNKIAGYQHGFTIIELLIVIVIGGIIGTAIAYSIANTFSFGSSNINLNTAINNVRYAGEWMSKDIRGGGTIIVTPDDTGTGISPGSGSIVLKWRDIQNTDHEITYNLTDDGILQRNYNSGISVVASSITSIGYEIDNITSSSVTNIKLDITATVKQKSYSKTYLVTIRN